MKTPFTPLCWTLAALGIVPAARLQAQTPIEDLEPASRLHFRLGASYRTGFKASVRDITPPVPTAPGTFGNGFVLPSVSGAQADQTWNWGYQDAGQVSGDTLTLERLNNGPRVGDLSGGAESLFGGELVVGVELGRFDLWKRTWNIGLEAGYSYARWSTELSGTAQSVATLTTAQYGLGGIRMPDAPYSGTLAGPGPLIDRHPFRQQTLTAAGTSTLNIGIESAVHTLRLGPYVELPLGRKLTLGFGVGYATVMPDTDLTLREYATFGASSGGGSGPTAQPGNGRAAGPAAAPPGAPALPVAIPNSALEVGAGRNDWQPGGYVQVRAQYDFTRLLGVFVAAEYLYNETMRFRAGGREVSLEMGGTYGATAGVRLSF